MSRFLHATGCWCALCAAAFANGAARELWLAPFMGSAAAHVASTFALCCVVAFVAHVHAGRAVRETRPLPRRDKAGSAAGKTAGDATGARGTDATDRTRGRTRGRTLGNAPVQAPDRAKDAAPRNAAAMWATGLYWMVATVAFEFLFGRYVAGNSWERLLADYDLTAGRVWVLVPLTLLLAPRLALWRLRRKGVA